MAKQPSERLYRLIHSLSGSEKRYFKLHMQREATRNRKYVELFDLLNKQANFDDTVVQQQLYGHVVEGKKYSELKAYLYDQLLAVLRTFDERNSVEHQLKAQLLSISSLFRRSLFDDCRILIEKTRKPARRFEHLHTLLQLLDWEKKLAYTRTDIPGLAKALPRIEARERELLTQLNAINTLQNLFFELLIGIRKSALRSAEVQARLETLRAHPLLRAPGASGTFRGERLYYRIRGIMAYAANDYPAFYTLSKTLIELLESRPAWLREDLEDYLAALNNFTVASGHLERYDEIETCLSKYATLREVSRDDAFKIFRQRYATQFRLLITQGKFMEAKRALDTHLAHKNSDRIERSGFYFQYFYIYFGNGDYTNALHWLNEWLNLPRSIERRDLQSLARVLNLIVHYEMDNILLLENLIRSTTRFLDRKDAGTAFERTLTVFFRKLLRLPPGAERRKAFATLQVELQRLHTSAAERAMLQLFDIEAWATAQERRQPFAQIVRERFEARLAE